MATKMAIMLTRNCRDLFMYTTAFQNLRIEQIQNMYVDCEEQNLFDTIEPHTTKFMAALNFTIYFSIGNLKNLKITTKEDLILFKGYILAKNLK